MSINNQLIILKQKNCFFVRPNYCIYNQFVPNRNTLPKKFDIFLDAIKYAKEYCNEEMIEYSYYVDRSCFQWKI